MQNYFLAYVLSIFASFRPEAPRVLPLNAHWVNNGETVHAA